LKKAIRKTINIKFNFLNRHFANRSFKLLDIGAGNHSATRTTDLFSRCEYYGLDIEKDYSNNETDFARMKEFYQLDLTKLDYSAVPDNYFDVILMTHVIEHLYNGDQVLPLLISKLKDNGLMYIEYPGIRSTRLPSMYGTLNFYDDTTHVRVYSVKELKKIVESNNCQVLKSGIRRNLYYLLAMPVRILYTLLKGERLNANLFWDLLGFAEFLEVKKVKSMA